VAENTRAGRECHLGFDCSRSVVVLQQAHRGDSTKCRDNDHGYDVVAHAAPHHESLRRKTTVRNEREWSTSFFQVAELPPGRYIVGLNLKDLPNKYNPYARTVYPGGPDPHVIELGLGQAVDLGSWQIPPPLPIVRIEGIITRRDGSPVAGVYVTAWDQTNNPVEIARGAGGATSGKDGRFVLELRRRRVYEFTVRDKRPRFLRTNARPLETGEAPRVSYTSSFRTMIAGTDTRRPIRTHTWRRWRHHDLPDATLAGPRSRWGHRLRLADGRRVVAVRTGHVTTHAVRAGPGLSDR